MQKGGNKGHVNFAVLIEKGIIKPGNNRLFLKKNKNTDEKIYLTLHNNGVVEYKNKFFFQNHSNYKLSINEEGKIEIPNNINKINDNFVIVKTMKFLKQLFLNSILGNTTKTIYQYLYYQGDSNETKDDNKPIWIPELGKENKDETKKNTKGVIAWYSNNEDLIRDENNYVMTNNNKKLRFQIDRSNPPRWIILKTPQKWTFKNLKIFNDEFNGNQLKKKQKKIKKIKLKNFEEEQNEEQNEQQNEEQKKTTSKEQSLPKSPMPKTTTIKEPTTKMPTPKEYFIKNKLSPIEEIGTSLFDEDFNEESVKETAVSVKETKTLINDIVFNIEDVKQKIIEGVTLDEFIEISKLRLKGLKVDKDYKKKQMPHKEKKFKSIVSKGFLRYAIIKDDPIRFYLYKGDNWKNNEEAFEHFKNNYLNKIKNILEKNQYIENREKSIQENENKEENKEENEEDVELEIEDVERKIFNAQDFNNDGECENIIETMEGKDIDIDDPNYNKYKNCIETVNKKRLNDNELPKLYPHLDDEDFSKKIFLKKEFNETKYDEINQKDFENIEQKVQELCSPTDFQLQPHQMFIRNYLSFNTPYNSILLFHGLGTGKTCSSISVTEEMRQNLKQMNLKKKIIIVASPVVQENYKLQLFDERKLKKVGGSWNIKSCTGNIFIKEINPINSKISREKLVFQIKKIIRNWYVFMGYTEFSNFINRTINKYRISEDDNPEQIKRKKKLIKDEFSNRMIVIDEVQNIRNIKKIKKSSINFLELVKYTENLKLLLLTATPMFNNPEEIVWLLNLMNINDNRVPINISDVFNKDGELLIGNNGEEIGKELLIRKMRGYVSYVRGENPFSFPNAIYPYSYNDAFSIKSLMESKQWSYPTLQINDIEITNSIDHLDILLTPIGEEQSEIYNYVIDKLKINKKSAEESKNGLQFAVVDAPLQILNFAYPHPDFNDGNTVIKHKSLYGKEGLERVMSFKNKNKNNKRKENYKYEPEILKQFGRIFSPNEIGKYSGKIKKIMDTIKNSKGIVLIYSQFIDGGCVPLALALEEMGITRYHKNKSLFKNKPTEDVDAVTLEPYSETKENIKFFPAKYAMITGDSFLSPNNKSELKACTDSENINGEIVKVIIISKAGSEGLDFKNIRQVHILEPWYNFMRTSQTIGRAIRNLSHCDLPYIERNVQIFLYATELQENRYEAIDLYMYRLAEKKGIKIGKISRLLKENAIDCLLNYPQTQMYKTLINKEVRQILSTGEEIDYKLGDREFSIMCDFMECKFACSSEINENDKINTTTYNERFLVVNSEVIIKKIKKLFTEKYFYTKKDLIKHINYSKKFPEEQINTSLQFLIDNKNEYLIDMIGRIGYLKNVNNLYLFHPNEMNEGAKLTNYKMRHPIQHNPEKIVFRLNNSITKQKQVINSSNIITQLNQSFLHLIKTPTSKFFNKKYIWEYNISLAIYSLVKYNNIEKELLEQFAIYHLLDILLYNEKIEFLKIIKKTEQKNDDMKLNNTLFRYVENYFEKFAFMYKEQKCYILRNNTEKTKFSVITITNQDVIKIDVKTAIFRILENKFSISLDVINPRFGFIGDINNTFVFKIKDLNNKKKNNTGRVCRGNKPDLVQLLNLFHNKLNGKDKIKMIGKNITGIYDTNLEQLKKHPLYNNKNNSLNLKPEQLCMEIELLLMYFNSINFNNKKWFFFSIHETLYGIKQLPKLTKIAQKIIN